MSVLLELLPVLVRGLEIHVYMCDGSGLVIEFKADGHFLIWPFCFVSYVYEDFMLLIVSLRVGGNASAGTQLAQWIK